MLGEIVKLEKEQIDEEKSDSQRKKIDIMREATSKLNSLQKKVL